MNCPSSHIITEESPSASVIIEECGTFYIETSAVSGVGADHYRGTYQYLIELEEAIPVAEEGDYAIVDVGEGARVRMYLWDNSDQEWVVPDSSSLTAAEIKALYEANPNTNAFTDNDVIKLGSLENYDDYLLSSRVTTVEQILPDKVDKEVGKSLSSNDFTNTYKQNVDSLMSGDYVWKESSW